ncbi:integrase [Oceanobacillus sp. E9]|uniref:site-specific integrase n=1 Tax=Oceanobacillus sp. E9 TaxID=1742575 RepID=UPI00084E90E0|nr:tyrosine-type recombinase/integrase [Oceanobacillus sp. E9]OEH54075.1 integrase [Oceanobacillus sp. E9]
MASFQKRGKTWQYTISRMVKGKSKPIRKGGFKTKKEAQIAASEMELELQKGVTPKLKPISLYDYFENWYRVFKFDVTNSTKTHYVYTLNIIEKYFGHTPIQQITKEEYQKFLNWFGETHAKETADKINIHIRGAVREAIDEGIIRIDFTRNAKVIGKVPAKKKSEKHLNYHESQLLISELIENLSNGLGYYLLLLAITTGLRYGELVGLTHEDFNFDNNTLRINKTWGYSRKMHIGFEPTKNPQSERVIRVDHVTMNLYQDLLSRLPKNEYDLIFYSHTSKYKVISNTNANKLLRKVLLSLDIKPITVHGLRHTHASLLLYKRNSIYYVSERLGHADIETTLRDYAHVIKELREEDESLMTNAFIEMYNSTSSSDALTTINN